MKNIFQEIAFEQVPCIHCKVLSPPGCNFCDTCSIAMRPGIGYSTIILITGLLPPIPIPPPTRLVEVVSNKGKQDPFLRHL